MANLSTKSMILDMYYKNFSDFIVEIIDHVWTQSCVLWHSMCSIEIHTLACHAWLTELDH